MDVKVYESKRKVTLKDGTVREYISKSTYVPKEKRPAIKSEIADLIKRIDDRDKLKLIKQAIIKINAGEIGENIIQRE